MRNMLVATALVAAFAAAAYSWSTACWFCDPGHERMQAEKPPEPPPSRLGMIQNADVRSSIPGF